MKILTVLGSPRIDGNTAKALSWIEDGIQNSGHTYTRVNLEELEIRNCKGCTSCKSDEGTLFCIQEDDVNGILQKMVDYDAVVLSSPLYMWSFASKIKALIDRTLPLVSGFNTPNHKSMIESKKVGLLVTCAGPDELNADLIRKQFDRWSYFVKTNTEGIVTVIPMTTTPDELGDSARKLTDQLVKNITS